LCDRLLDIVLQNPLVSKAKITIAKPEAVNFAENVFVSMKKKQK
jgi:dihydroneopterin aldolase